jgi:hypothetical protein
LILLYSTEQTDAYKLNHLNLHPERNENQFDQPLLDKPAAIATRIKPSTT